ncbi:hypothetical protein PAPHI01_1301 [Pancytospora philotis]|nr:hypothetical protein PAPHI01_1301 [Pancytospora philotis]
MFGSKQLYVYCALGTVLLVGGASYGIYRSTKASDQQEERNTDKPAIYPGTDYSAPKKVELDPVPSYGIAGNIPAAKSEKREPLSYVSEESKKRIAEVYECLQSLTEKYNFFDSDISKPLNSGSQVFLNKFRKFFASPPLPIYYAISFAQVLELAGFNDANGLSSPEFWRDAKLQTRFWNTVYLYTLSTSHVVRRIVGSYDNSTSCEYTCERSFLDCYNWACSQSYASTFEYRACRQLNSKIEKLREFALRHIHTLSPIAWCANPRDEEFLRAVHSAMEACSDAFAVVVYIVRSNACYMDETFYEEATELLSRQKRITKSTMLKDMLFKSSWNAKQYHLDAGLDSYRANLEASPRGSSVLSDPDVLVSPTLSGDGSRKVGRLSTCEDGLSAPHLFEVVCNHMMDALYDHYCLLILRTETDESYGRLIYSLFADERFAAWLDTVHSIPDFAHHDKIALRTDVSEAFPPLPVAGDFRLFNTNSAEANFKAVVFSYMMFRLSELVLGPMARPDAPPSEQLGSHLIPLLNELIAAFYSMFFISKRDISASLDPYVNTLSYLLGQELVITDMSGENILHMQTEMPRRYDAHAQEKVRAVDRQQPQSAMLAKVLGTCLFGIPCSTCKSGAGLVIDEGVRLSFSIIKTYGPGTRAEDRRMANQPATDGRQAAQAPRGRIIIIQGTKSWATFATQFFIVGFKSAPSRSPGSSPEKHTD